MNFISFWFQNLVDIALTHYHTLTHKTIEIVFQKFELNLPT